MSTDFIDDDLLKMRDAGDDDEGVNTRADGTDVGKMARQREDIGNQVAGAADEIERLRMRQAELEKAKKNLEDLSRKHEEYEQGKKEMLDKLTRGLTMVEREEIQATRMVELLSETRSRFRELLDDLSEIDETKWTEDGFKTELSRALVKVDMARADYKKALARIDAVSWYKPGDGEKRSDVLQEMARDVSGRKDFAYWLKVGLAVSLPMIVVTVLACLAVLLSVKYWHFLPR